MTNETKSLEGMIAAFGVAHQIEAQALRTMLDNTPALKARVELAIANGQLSGFAPHPLDGTGSYNPKTGVIQLPMDLLGDAKMHLANDAPGNTTRIVLGHEIGHALNKADIEKTNQGFADKIGQIATTPSPHDYTDAMHERGAVQRARESKDEIAGINSLVDFVKAQKPHATLKDVYDASREMQSYIDKTGTFKPVYTAKEGLTFGPDLKIAETPKNVEAMGKLFYDARGYPQNYGAVGLALIAQAEKKVQAENPTQPAPTVQADLASLGIDASKVPAEWLPEGFVDKPATQRLTDASPATPSPADEALTSNIRNGVVGLEKALGKTWDDNSERLTASLALLAKQKGYGERDNLSVMFNDPTPTLRGGELVFLHRTGDTASPDPHANRAHLTTSDAIARPALESCVQMNALTVQSPVQAPPQQTREVEQGRQASVMTMHR